jgi:hypothetical protein
MKDEGGTMNSEDSDLAFILLPSSFILESYG